jgi:hypothetical protein
MPYGPLYTGHGEDDRKDRGLIGLFLCADLERQYEFIMRQWAQGDRATSGIVGQQDPIIGAQSEVNENCPMSGQFRIPRDGGEGDVVLQMPRLVQTVGSVYLFMPGLAGLRHLAEENGAPPKTAGYGTQSAQAAQGMVKSDYRADEPDPATFDPRAREFRADPFAIYKQFRANHPIVDLPLMESTWVFSYEDVDKIARNPDLFRKRKSDDKSPAGLLNMDGLAHKECRREIQYFFDEVLKDVRAGLKDKVEQCYAANCKNKGQVRPIDWVAQFAKPLAHAVFFDLFGLEHSTWLIRQVEDILALTRRSTPSARNSARICSSTRAVSSGHAWLVTSWQWQPCTTPSRTRTNLRSQDWRSSGSPTRPRCA